MKHTLLCIFTLTFLFGCKHSEEASDTTGSKRLYLPTWSYLAKASATYAKGQTQLPKAVYVFPAMRLNAQAKPIDVLKHRVLEDGTLWWNSAAPLGAELKAIAEKKLSKLGFTPIPFGELTSVTTDHSVLVLNLYYREAIASQDNPKSDSTESWTTFSRITAATFTKDLNPLTKRDVMNQELVSLFNGREISVDVIKRSQTYLLDYVGTDRQWSESINLLH
jgi:hypothetical protein